MAVIDWLLQGRPGDSLASDARLTDAPGRDVAAERSRVAPEGWGARLLSLLGDEGAGKPSRWNTLRALRALRWFRGGNPART